MRDRLADLRRVMKSQINLGDAPNNTFRGVTHGRFPAYGSHTCKESGQRNIGWRRHHAAGAAGGVPGVDVHTVPFANVSACVATLATCAMIAPSVLIAPGFLIASFKAVMASATASCSITFHIDHLFKTMMSST